MLLQSVPALHGGRDPGLWADRVGRCLFHEHDPEADAEAPATEDDAIMAEIEPGHLVTCANVDRPEGCPQARNARAA